MKIKSILASLLTGISSSVFADPFIVPYAAKGPESGRVNSPIKLLSKHDVSIHNYTDHVLAFEIYYLLCANIQKRHGSSPHCECVTKQFPVNVGAGQNYHNEGNVDAVVSYQWPGTFNVSAITRIVNSSHHLSGYSGEKMDMNVITVFP